MALLYYTVQRCRLSMTAAPVHSDCSHEILSCYRASERLYMEIPIAAASSAEVSGTMFEGLVQSLAECCAGGDGRSDARAMSMRKSYKKH